MTIVISHNLAGPHLDLQAALAKIGDASAVSDMLGMLVDLLAKDVPQIRQALLSHDLDLAGRLLHALKGCMPIFCTAPICDQVAMAERHSKLGELSQAQQVFNLLAPALADLALEIQSHLASPAAALK